MANAWDQNRHHDPCPNADKAGSPAVGLGSEDIPLQSVINGVTLVEALLAKYDESRFETDLALLGIRMPDKAKEKTGTNNLDYYIRVL